MKQILKCSLALAMVLALALSLAACGSSSDSSEAASSQSASSEPAAPAFDYSAMLDDNGHWKGVKASKLVTLPKDLVGVKFPAEVCTVTDEQVQQVIDNILQSASTGNEHITDRAIKDGDRVNMDYVGTVDGVEFTGGNTNGKGTTVTAGSPQYIDDFLTQIIGHRPGETMDVVVTFPDDYKDSTDPDGKPMVLAGKEAVFKTTLNYIEGDPILPELNDKFVEDWFAESPDPTMAFKTVDELRDSIRSDLKKTQKMNWLHDWLLESAKVSEVPADVLEHVKGIVMADMAQQAAGYGMDVDTLMEMQGTTKEEYLESVADELKSTAEYFLTLQAVAEQEKLEVSEKQGREILGDSYDTVVATYGKGYTHQVLMAQTVLEHLLEKGVES